MTNINHPVLRQVRSGVGWLISYRNVEFIPVLTSEKVVGVGFSDIFGKPHKLMRDINFRR